MNTQKNNFHTRQIIKTLIDEVGELDEDAFYVCDTEEIRTKHKIWCETFPNYIKSFYTVKCNDNMEVLKTLSELNIGFDCASKNEILKVLSLNVNTDQIIFGHPSKQESHIKFAADKRIKTLTFDTESELYKIKKYHPDAELVLRIKCASDKTELLQFGCDINNAKTLLTLAKILDLCVVGISFNNPEQASKSFEEDFHIFEQSLRDVDKISKFVSEVGFDLKLVDIGSVPKFNNNKLAALLDKYISSISNNNNNNNNIEVIAKSDRFFMESAFTLVTRIHSKKTSKTDSHKMYYCPRHGAFGSFNLIIFSRLKEKIKPVPANREFQGDEKLYSTTFWGPTCDCWDSVLKNVQFPEMDVGDWLIFENLGAYSLSMCSNFNGVPIPRVYYVSK